jgi:hypothetical protein
MVLDPKVNFSYGSTAQFWALAASMKLSVSFRLLDLGQYQRKMSYITAINFYFLKFFSVCYLIADFTALDDEFDKGLERNGS